MKPYRHLYPFPPDALARVAYYFEFDYEDGRDAASYAAPAVEFVRGWMADGRRGDLWVFPDGDGGVVVDDRRPGSEGTTRLSGWRAAVFEACDRAQPLGDVARLASGLGAGTAELAASTRAGRWTGRARHEPPRTRSSRRRAHVPRNAASSAVPAPSLSLIHI